MIEATGWTLEEFDRTPFPFCLELYEEFIQSPPAHVLMRGMVKYDPPPRRMKLHKRNPNEPPPLPKPFDLEAEKQLPPAVQEARRQMREEAVRNYVAWQAGQKGKEN